MNYKSLDNLANNSGGPLRLTSLIVSRARQIVKKSPLYVDTKIDDPVEIAFMELMDGRIKLSEEASR